MTGSDLARGIAGPLLMAFAIVFVLGAVVSIGAWKLVAWIIAHVTVHP